MKTNACTFGLVAALALLLTGCQTVYTTYTQDIGAPTYPPTNPANVQILRAEPTRPHVQLGQIRCEPSSDSVPASKIEAALQKDAAKLGADAAVVIYDKTQIMGSIITGPLYARQVETIEGRVVVAVAIKYK